MYNGYIASYATNQSAQCFPPGVRVSNAFWSPSGNGEKDKARAVVTRVGTVGTGFRQGQVALTDFWYQALFHTGATAHWPTLVQTGAPWWTLVNTGHCLQCTTLMLMHCRSPLQLPQVSPALISGRQCSAIEFNWTLYWWWILMDTVALLLIYQSDIAHCVQCNAIELNWMQTKVVKLSPVQLQKVASPPWYRPTLQCIVLESIGTMLLIYWTDKHA